MNAARPRRKALWLGLFVLALALTVVGFTYFFGDHFLRQRARVILEAELKKLLRGELHVDRIAELSLTHVVAEGVTMLDPQKRAVLTAKRVELGIDLSTLPAGIRFSYGRLSDGRVRAYPSEEAALSLFEAFLPQASDDAPQDGEAFAILFDDIRITQLEVVGDVPGIAGVHIEDLEVGASIHVKDELAVRITSGKARVTAPYEEPLVVERITTQIDTTPFRIAATAEVARDEEHVSAKLSYVLPAQGADALHLALELAPVTPEFVRELGLALPDTLYGELRGSLVLEGPTDALRFRTDLTTEGGPLTIRGEFPEGGTTRIYVESSRLSLPEVLAYAPPVELGFAVDVSAPPDGPVEITGEAPFIDVLGFSASRTKLRGRYSAGRFTIERASLQYAGGAFDVQGWVNEDADFALDVRSTVPDTQREARLRHAGFSAKLDSDVHLERRGSDFHVSGAIELARVSYRGLSASALEVEGRIDIHDDDFARPVVRVRGRAQNLSVPNLTTGDLTFSLNGRAGRYTSNAHMFDPRGRSVNARAVLTVLEGALHIEANPVELKVLGHDAWRARADVIVKDNGVEFRDVVLASGPQRLELSGSYSFSQAYSVEATAQSFDVGGLRELLELDLADIDGLVDGKVMVSGVPGHPRIDAQGSLRNGVFLGMTDLTVLLSLVFADGRFDVESEVGLPDGSSLSLYLGGEPGRGRTWGDEIYAGNYQFALDFARLPFEVTRPWLAWLGLEPPAGTISATVRGAGTLDNPTIEVSTEVRGLAFGAMPPSDIDASLKHDGNELTVDHVDIYDAHGKLLGINGNLEAELTQLFDPVALRSSLDSRPFTLNVQVPPRRLDELPEPIQLDFPVYGSGELRAKQSDKGPRVEVVGQLGWPPDRPGIDACGLERRPAVHFVVRAQQHDVAAELSAIADKELVAWASANAKPNLTQWITGDEEPHVVPVRLNARLSAVETEELPWLCSLVAGPLRAELIADNLFANPPELRFSIDSQSLQLVPHANQRRQLGNLQKTRTLGRAFKLHASGGVERERVSFLADIEQGETSSLEIYGAIPRGVFRRKAMKTDITDPIEARLRARRFELAPVLLAFPLDVRAAGTLDGEFRVAYYVPDARMELEGALDLADGRLAIAALGQELTDVTARLRMENNRLTIEELAAREYDGRLNANGQVTFVSASQAEAELKLHVNGFPVRNEGIEVSQLTGDIGLRAELTKARTRAELDVSNLRVDLPMQLDTDFQSLSDHPDIVIKGQAPPTLPEDPHMFEILVRANPPFRVRRTDLSADVLADLTVRYRSPELTMQGSAELKRGNFELYGKRFELRESRMAFDGGPELDPLVSLYAVHKVGGDEIGVRVEGRLSDPIVTFTHSDPDITNTGDIIAELLGGRRDETASGERDATSAAANVLAGATAGLLTQSVRERFGGALPVFSIESSGQTFRNTRIRAGIQLDSFLEKRLGPLRHVVRGAYIEGFVSPGAGTSTATTNQSTVPQSRGGGLLELRFPRDFVGSVEYRPVQNWRLDVAWEP